MPYELQIALRYLLAKRKQAFISVISLVSILGVTVGVMALVIALALMTGLQEGVRDRILGASAHVYVWKQGGILDYQAEAARLTRVPGVVGAAPAVMGKAIVTSPRGERFITVKGVDAALERDVTELARAMTSGSLDALAPAGDEDLPGLLLGQALATELGAFVGDSVTLITPTGTLSPMGMMPRQRRLRVVGLFSMGLFEFDQAYGFVALDTAMRLAGTAEVNHLEVRVDDIYRAPDVARRITAELGPEYLTQDWTEMNQSLYSALWLEKVAISIAIGLIVMVAALNIIASLILLVMEKSRDIAILKTMGASARSVMVVFMLQGLIIGLIGTATGAATGVLIAGLLDRYQLVKIPSDVYQLSHLPFTVLPWDLAIVIAGAVVICFLATLYPSRQAARLDPAQGLRYE
ncbi:MAG: lipoprotein-releasing ABC transporter permease subunit [Vicinamibacterales bacterium]|nr:lipoprotein-releasing ABC transporter permease subunit [Vicinamibacterales bacterium]